MLELRLWVVALAIAKLASCAPDQTTIDVAPARLSTASDTAAPTRETCAAQGATLERRGLLNLEMCVKRYSDAGKACRGSDECQGMCIVNEQTGLEVPEGSRVAGQCQPDDALFSCYAEVVRGRRTRRVCVD